jgi:hypothetical protein
VSRAARIVVCVAISAYALVWVFAVIDWCTSW